MLSSINNYLQARDIDYADILMLLLAALVSIPVVTMAGYGIATALTTFIGF